jgi:8-oxo-dGTP diphosphatase
MSSDLHRSMLRAFGRLPRPLRRWVIRLVSPNYTVGAIAVISRSDGSILLVRQAYRERWGIPGGLLKRGEDPAIGAVREVLEEVGLLVRLEGEPAVVVDAGPQRVDLVFRARPADGIAPEIAAPCSPEIEETRWFPLDALPELQPETAQALVALARSARSPQAHRLSPD